MLGPSVEETITHQIRLSPDKGIRDVPIDTKDCVRALEATSGDIATFVWSECHRTKLPSEQFEVHRIFEDPIFLVLPRNELYLDFLSQNGLKRGRSIGDRQLRILLSNPTYVNTQEVLMREDGSGTRTQIEAFLRTGDPGFTIPNAVEHRSTEDIYAKLAQYAQAVPAECYRIGFVSEKIRLLADGMRKNDHPLIFLKLSRLERHFSVVWRKTHELDPVNVVGKLMVRIASEAELDLHRRAVPLWQVCVFFAIVIVVGLLAQFWLQYAVQVWLFLGAILAVPAALIALYQVWRQFRD